MNLTTKRGLKENLPTISKSKLVEDKEAMGGALL